MQQLRQPTTVVSLKSGTHYYGLYQIEVTHLPTRAVASTAFMVLTGVALLVCHLNNAPEWITVLLAWITGGFLYTSVSTVVRIVLQSPPK